MHCPVDNATLTMSERSGIEIDYCPQCRGVWLDRGELDKIIDRAGSQGMPGGMPPQQAPRYEQPREPYYGDRDRSYDDDRDRRDGGYRGHDQKPYRKKRENWLSELFD